MCRALLLRGKLQNLPILSTVFTKVVIDPVRKQLGGYRLDGFAAAQRAQSLLGASSNGAGEGLTLLCPA